jgi:hypothetical protein
VMCFAGCRKPHVQQGQLFTVVQQRTVTHCWCSAARVVSAGVTPKCCTRSKPTTLTAYCVALQM